MNQGARQEGVALIIALVALVAMTLAGISLMRTVDTTNVISGNLSFNEATTQMADVGADAAFNWIISNKISIPTSCQNIAANCPASYSPDLLPLDPTTGTPILTAGMSWTPVVNPTGMSADYQASYIIERMCGVQVGGGQQTGGALVLTNTANCMATPVYDIVNKTLMTGQGQGIMYFRVTVKVTGPRNTQALSQYFPSQPDNIPGF